MRILFTALVALILVPGPVGAQGWIEPLPRPVPFANGPAVTKLRTSVRVQVRDRVATVEVEEWFRNDGPAGLGEGDYLYPLPGEAVFSDFSLFQGDQELKGETMDAATARSIYEEIVRRKKDPALIELVGHGLVRARVFPIQPGETRRIILRYTQVLPRAGDAVQFRYAAGSRSPGGTVRLDGDRPAALPQNQAAPISLRMVVADGVAYREPFSPTHALHSERGNGELVVTPAGELHGDLAIFLPLAGAPVGLTLAAHRPAGEDGFFMLTLSPDQVTDARVPRDVTVVVDVSGSMAGEKLEQARGALRQLLGTLGPDDRLRLIRFSNAVHGWREGWTRTTPDELRDAGAWVDGLTASGGTNVSGALEEAFGITTPGDRLPMVLFLTDGLPSVGEQNPERIAATAEAARGRARVFAFGVGYDVNTVLLDGLSAAGRGSTQYVRPGEDVEQAIGLLAARIRLPVLTELALDGTPVQIQEVYPSRLPDLFAGEELVILGRYRGESRGGTVAVRGERSGRVERYATDAVFPARESGNDFLPRLWASRKLGELTRTIRLEGATPELVEEVRRTALRFGLLSEYTSHLVLEQDAMVTGIMPPAAPVAAQSNAAVVGKGAVNAAEMARRGREARTLADVAATQEEAEAALPGSAAGSRTVAGRQFILRDGVWEDAAHMPEQRLVRVKLFSAAYFDLLQQLPELEPYARALPALLIAGGGVSIRFGEDGTETLTAAELRRLAADFRAP